MSHEKLSQDRRESPQYIVVTPCKNEEKNLQNLINSIELQTIKPAVWVIVDDGSTDDTPSIIRKAQNKYKWIRSIQLNCQKRDRGLHLANIIKIGFDIGTKYCEKEQIDYAYLSNVDSDIILEKDYFEKILFHFESNPFLGSASGSLHHYEVGKLVTEEINKSEPPGACIVIRRKCFEQCEGIFVSYAWESVFNTKAKLKNWKTKVFENITAIEVRDTNSAEGYWKGYIYKGKCAHYLNFNPLHVLAKTVLYFFKKPYFIGFAYIYGYLESLLSNEQKINDEDIKYYFRHTRARETILYYKCQLKNKLKLKN